jgi:hypothetical protein
MWLRADGSCYAGHYRGMVIEPYEVEGANPPPAVELGFPQTNPQPVGLIAAAVFLGLLLVLSAASLVVLGSGENGRALRKAIEQMQSRGVSPQPGCTYTGTHD